MLCNRLFTPLFFPHHPSILQPKSPYTPTKTDERTNTMHPSVYSYLLLFTPLYSKQKLLRVKIYFPNKANALFSAASIISRSPGPLSLMPQR